MRLQSFINEGTVKVTPMLKSVLGKPLWDKITKKEVDELISALSSINDATFSLAPVMAGKMKGNNKVTIINKDKDYGTVSKDTTSILTKAGWKTVKSIEGDGGSWVIYFTK